MTPVEKIVHQILYTRYTMVSAGMSIIPEMMEKIDLDGTTKYFKTTKTDREHYLVEFFFICPLFRFIADESSDTLDGF